jgi:hypothetical protein
MAKATTRSGHARVVTSKNGSTKTVHVKTSSVKKKK